MSLYAIGDFHLSFAVHKPMDIFDPVWKDHEKKLAGNLNKILKEDDTLVITGDHSWGKTMEECLPDLAFIEKLPGKKVLLRGNHDMFWNANKTEPLNRQFEGRLLFLQNNFFTYQDRALVGTKGYCFEGKDTVEHFYKLRDREIKRLEKSFEEAKKAGYQKFVMFLHYPPTSIGEEESPFTRIAEAYGVSDVVYSHCHGKDRYNDSFKGMVNGICYHLVSSDYLQFCPEKIID